MLCTIRTCMLYQPFNTSSVPQPHPFLLFLLPSPSPRLHTGALQSDRGALAGDWIQVRFAADINPEGTSSCDPLVHGFLVTSLIFCHETPRWLNWMKHQTGWRSVHKPWDHELSQKLNRLIYRELTNQWRTVGSKWAHHCKSQISSTPCEGSGPGHRSKFTRVELQRKHMFKATETLVYVL